MQSFVESLVGHSGILPLRNETAGGSYCAGRSTALPHRRPLRKRKAGSAPRAYFREWAEHHSEEES